MARRPEHRRSARHRPWWQQSDRRTARRRRARRLSRAVDVALDLAILVLLTVLAVIAGATLVLAGPLATSMPAGCPVPTAGCVCAAVAR